MDSSFQYTLPLQQSPSVTEAAFPLSPTPYRLQTMDEYVRIPDIVMAQVELCMGIRHDIQQYIHSDEGLMEYVSTIVRPFAHCVSLCIPAGAVEVRDFPVGRGQIMWPIVVELVVQTVGLPSVPHWTYMQIEAFKKEEKDNSMVFEKMTLEVEYDAAMRLRDNLVRAQEYAEIRYGAGPSGHRARRLAEAILQVFLAGQSHGNSKQPPVSGTSVELGKASVRYGPFKLRGPGQSFVPYEATVLFGLAEGFTDAFGFERDDAPEERAALFHHLDQLFQNMVLCPKYSSNDVDFPNFHVDVRTMYLFGVTPWIKSSQVAKVVLAAVGDRHRFGDNLLRYHPSLGEEGRFVIAIPDDLFAPTRPCTPDVGDLSTFSERDETAEGESLEDMVYGRLSQAVFDEVAEGV
ncbi:hypothetical protein FB451DRAFT_1178290 [Mycena latifolia]|nr:hypothetical protein FB451DRAFT_1178290 [Mycena latifolia]